MSIRQIYCALPIKPIVEAAPSWRTSMNAQRPSNDPPDHAVEEGDQPAKDGPTANQPDKKTPDIKPDQIAADDPHKAQKLTQAGRSFDVDEAEE
ncbi:hypothetical protein FPZ24_04970 [Sphingomonas panacisoli]|uniref:Uncharacterized protein n=1 Tax=Sphingomonas panacisoli TaxID=1813879 RepID=A0A5B8LH35_9SPHN|nr:hypothetical protein [Sphingomonas panacisoli]QDZ06912.1 hypothetical protein FPZ24_04970 [Sphingomonas panacisoli]